MSAVESHNPYSRSGNMPTPKKTPQKSDAVVIPGNAPKSRPTKPCPITQDDFQSLATPLLIDLGGPQYLVPRVFDSGSYGFGLYGKVNLKIGDKVVPCQATFNLTVIGSKPDDK